MVAHHKKENPSTISKPSDQENKYLHVRDLITHQRLITISENDTLDKALMLMLKYDIRHLPVVAATTTASSTATESDTASTSGGGRGDISDEDQRLVGIITERDMRLAAASPVIDPEIDLKEMIHILHEHKVKEAMQHALYTASEGDSILAACKIMRLSKRGALPVLRGDKLVGIVTQTDLLDHLIRVLEPLKVSPLSQDQKQQQAQSKSESV